jgi:hypothetical protein
MLVRTGRALGFGVPLPALAYYAPCQGSPLNASAACVNRTYPCPAYVGAPGAFCYRVRVDARDQTGVFLGSADPLFMEELGGHAMNVVGYNDAWLYRNRFQSAQASAQHKGGFILHNSWGARGHSVKYLYGDESEENEAVICPNHVSPFNWIPASYECVAEAAAKGIDVNRSVRCPDLANVDVPPELNQPPERIRGRGRTTGADLLRLKGSNASDPVFYVLENNGAKFTASGLADVSFIAIDTSQTPNQISRTTVKILPFYALSSLFEPVPATLVANDPENCGYWIMPYDTLNNMIRINWDLLDNFRVVDYDIEFTGTSYALHPNTSAAAVELLKNGTRIRNRPKFDGPLPFNIIYK